MTRTTRTELDAIFRNYMRTLWARGVEVGEFALIRHTGGYRIERIHATDGGYHSLPFGHAIRSAKEMASSMRHAQDAVMLTPQLRATSAGATVLLPAPAIDSDPMPESIAFTSEELHGFAERRVCGRELVLGGKSAETYATSCDLLKRHLGDHEGPSPFESDERRVQWVGGGSIEGDPLPARVTDWIESETTSEAETLARVTGSTGATVRHEHRDPQTGELVTDSEQSWTRKSGDER